MEYISQQTVDVTWTRVAGLSPSDVRPLQRRHGQAQPELVGFTIASTSELRPAALGVGLYVALVVHEMFWTVGSKVRKARERVVLRHWQRTYDVVAGLRDRGFQPASLVSTTVETSEPHVVQYVIDALNEDGGDDPVALSVDEFWHLFAVLKTVIETLHEMIGPAPAPSPANR